MKIYLDEGESITGAEIKIQEGSVLEIIPATPQTKCEFSNNKVYSTEVKTDELEIEDWDKSLSQLWQKWLGN